MTHLTSIVRRTALLLSALSLAACSDTAPTATSVEHPVLATAAEGSCSTCVFGPQTFVQQAERIGVPFRVDPSLAGSCTLWVLDDGQPATTARVWFNGRIVVDYPALFGPTASAKARVTVNSGLNTINVSVRGGEGHFVTARIVCGERIAITPDPVVRSTGEAQQFSVSGFPGPYTWSVNGIDGGNGTYGTVDVQGLYLAPAAVPAPASFPVCVRVTASPKVAACATVTVLPPPAPRITISSGDGQAARPGVPVPIAPAVLVTRADGSPWPGVTVTFAVASGGGAVVGAAPTTGVDGIATVGSWTLGPSPGTNTLTATAGASGVAGNPAVFTALGSEVRARLLVANSFQTCGLAAGGFAYCWGGNSFGQLGDSTTQSRSVPTAVKAARLTFASMSMGIFDTCGLTPGGHALCWGTVPGTGFDTMTFVSFSAGQNYTCGVTVDRTGYCWGDNAYGELGDGSYSSHLAPTAVAGGLTFETIVASDVHTCGLTTSGTAYCWGFNTSGELGDGSKSMSIVPVPVSGGYRFIQLSLGDQFTCGLTPEHLTLCWGSNLYGQVGDGTTIDQTLPRVVNPEGNWQFAAIQAGGFHACGLVPGGAAYCWGRGLNGELGTGGRIDRTRPVPVAGGLSFTALAAGWQHTCGLVGDGSAYCWGSNDYGALGDGTTTNRLTPVAVIGGLQFRLGAP